MHCEHFPLPTGAYSVQVRASSHTQSPRSVVSTVFSQSAPGSLHNNTCGRVRQPQLVSRGGFSGSLAAHRDKYSQQLHKQESRMVVNVLLASPQFSSTLVRRLILKHNNLELMLGRLTLRVGREGLIVSSCTSTLGVCGTMRSVLFSNQFKFIHSCACRA